MGGGGGTSQHLAKHSKNPLLIEQCAISCSQYEVVANINTGQQWYGMKSQQCLPVDWI